MPGVELVITTISGIVLCLFGVALWGASVTRVWHGMVRYQPPTPYDRGQHRNARGMALYTEERPRVAVMRFRRRAPRRRESRE